MQRCFSKLPMNVIWGLTYRGLYRRDIYIHSFYSTIYFYPPPHSARFFLGAWRGWGVGVGWIGMSCRTTRTQVYFLLAAKLMESPVCLSLDHAAQDKTSLSRGRSGPEEGIWCSGLPPPLWLQLLAGETQALSSNKHTKSVDHYFWLWYHLD